MAMRKMMVGIMYLVFVGTLLAGCAADKSYQAGFDQSGAIPKQSNEKPR